MYILAYILEMLVYFYQLSIVYSLLVQPVPKSQSNIYSSITSLNLIHSLGLKTDNVIKIITHDLDTFEKCNLTTNYRNIVIIGQTGNLSNTHPVTQVVLSRWKSHSKPGQRKDCHRIALAIEGGGMRGCVSAGATAALTFLGLNDAIDVVYGSSAGAMVGAYFVSRQSDGVQIYYDYLPTAGSIFINKLKLLQAAGINTNIWKSLQKHSRNHNHLYRYNHHNQNHYSYKNEEDLNDVAVFNLKFLLLDAMKKLKRLDWNIFQENSKVQPLRIVTSSLQTLQSKVLSLENRNYYDLDSLLNCIRASMSVPGITGNMMAICNHNHSISDLVPHFILPTKNQENKEYLTDAFLCEPIPYRSACVEGATHIIVLRSKPDPCEYLGSKNGKLGIYEKVIGKRFFKLYEQNKAMDWMMNMRHNRLYAEDLIRLNLASSGPEEGIEINGRRVHLLPIAYQTNSKPNSSSKNRSKVKEVGQLENRREKILEGVKQGAGRVLDIFLPAILEQQQSPQQLIQDVDETRIEYWKSQIMEMMFPSDYSMNRYKLSRNNLYDIHSCLQGHLIINNNNDNNIRDY